MNDKERKQYKKRGRKRTAPVWDNTGGDILETFNTGELIYKHLALKTLKFEIL